MLIFYASTLLVLISEESKFNLNWTDIVQQSTYYTVQINLKIVQIQSRLIHA